MTYRTIRQPALPASFSVDEVKVFARGLPGPSTTTRKTAHGRSARSASIPSNGRHIKMKASSKRRKH